MIYKLPDTIKELQQIILDLETRAGKLKSERDQVLKELRAYRQISKRLPSPGRQLNTGKQIRTDASSENHGSTSRN